MKEFKIIDCDGGLHFLYGKPLFVKAFLTHNGVIVEIRTSGTIVTIKAYEHCGNMGDLEKHEIRIENFFTEYTRDELRWGDYIDFSNKDKIRIKLNLQEQESATGGVETRDEQKHDNKAEIEFIIEEKKLSITDKLLLVLMYGFLISGAIWCAVSLTCAEDLWFNDVGIKVDKRSGEIFDIVCGKGLHYYYPSKTDFIVLRENGYPKEYQGKDLEYWQELCKNKGSKSLEISDDS